MIFYTINNTKKPIENISAIISKSKSKDVKNVLLFIIENKMGTCPDGLIMNVIKFNDIDLIRVYFKYFSVVNTYDIPQIMKCVYKKTWQYFY